MITQQALRRSVIFNENIANIDVGRYSEINEYFNIKDRKYSVLFYSENYRETDLLVYDYESGAIEFEEGYEAGTLPFGPVDLNESKCCCLHKIPRIIIIRGSILHDSCKYATTQITMY